MHQAQDVASLDGGDRDGLPAPPAASGGLSQMVVDRLRQSIRTGVLRVGVSLPSERELCEQFGVSRVTVREALRVLEANGLIEKRLGGHGGSFVTAPTARTVGAGITDLLSVSALAPSDVTEARAVFELGIVPLVCQHATEQELRELGELCDRAEAAREDGSYTVEMSFDFHLAVATASHNPAITMILMALREPVLVSLQEAQHEGTQGVAEHRAFVDALRSRDVDAARELMRRHLARTAERLARTRRKTAHRS